MDAKAVDDQLSSLAPLCSFMFWSSSECAAVARSSSPEEMLKMGCAAAVSIGAGYSEDLFCLLEEHGLEGLRRKGDASRVLELVRQAGFSFSQGGGFGNSATAHTFGHSVARAMWGCGLGIDASACAALGVMKAAEISRALGRCAAPCIGRIDRCLKSFGLPNKVPHSLFSAKPWAAGAIVRSLCSDDSDAARMTLLCGVGTTTGRVPLRVPQSILLRVISTHVTLRCPQSVKGSVRVPGSKSMSNRVLLLAGISKGECIVRGLLHSDDTQVMMSALAQLGASFEWREGGDALLVRGNGGNFTLPSSDLYMSNAGTATRFMITLLTLVGKGGGTPTRTVLTGSDRMLVRPQGPLVKALKAHGCDIEYLGNENHLPLSIKGGGLPGGRLPLEGKVSSQFVSSVLLSAPYANDTVDIVLAETSPTSITYIDMTVEVMRAFGVHVKRPAINRFIIEKGQQYISPAAFDVEGDASSATYALAMAAITQGEVTVHGVGSSSLQGDAGFCRLLEKMGCRVSQTENSTTVVGPPPGQLKGIDVDMADLTDAFLTATVVAACAEGTTRISGIANQHVKECDRIAAMVQGLERCGIVARDLPDGIEIDGAGDKPGRSTAFVDCYDDHRIAMSFGVLALRRDVVVTDKDCVDKTYPEFWDHAANDLSITVAGESTETLGSTSKRTPSKYSTLVLVGMRGAGKTTLGKIAASELGCSFVDLDDIMEERNGGKSCGDIIGEAGWEAFRAMEQEILVEAMAASSDGLRVISCGGGVVESEIARQALQSAPAIHGCRVVHVERHIDDIVEYLESNVSDARRPGYGESIRAVWERRMPWFSQVSTHRFHTCKGDDDWDALESQFRRFVNHIFGMPRGRHVTCLHPGTYSICMTSPDLSKEFMENSVRPASIGHDSLEVRADLLGFGTDGAKSVSDEVTGALALLRRHGTKLPFIFTVRTKEEGGVFEGTDEELLELYGAGVSFGCEVLDLGYVSDSVKARVLSMIEGSNTKIISSAHIVSQTVDLFTDAQLESWFHECLVPPTSCSKIFAEYVACVKVVGKASSMTCALRVHAAAKRFQAQRSTLERGIPVVALCTQTSGYMSRVMNTFLGFTPVCHPSMAEAAPGQLSKSQIIDYLKDFSGSFAKYYYLFGSPIQGSPSPTLHNTGFKAAGLDGSYFRCDSMDVERMENEIKRPTFMGASVTIPFKRAVMQFVDELTQEAEAVGAVNTIVKQPSGKLVGDNTDWVGMKNVLGDIDVSNGGAALILGAGGTSAAACFCVRNLGFSKIFVYNRTLEKAEDMAARFGCEAIASLDADTLTRSGCVALIIGTVPASAGLTVPEHLLGEGTIVLDAAYTPRITPLLRQALDRGCRVHSGIEMLIAQGIAQFNMWTDGAGVDAAVRERMVRTANAYYDLRNIL